MASSTLKTRVITGIVLGCVLIGGILWNEYSFAALLVLILLVATREYIRLASTLQIYPNVFATYSGNLLVFSASVYFTVQDLAYGINAEHILFTGSAFVAWFLFLIGSELFRTRSKPLENIAASVFALLYLGTPISLLLLSARNAFSEYDPLLVLFFFFFMWASDTGAYFTGRAIGKHKLFERHSPKKTIEGFVGGIITAGLVGWAAWALIGQLSLSAWISIGCLLSVTGTLGDLVESMFKRQAGIKDSGNVLPGHGGILDRFDSTFFSAPVYYLMLQFLN